jgi:uncharacterized protein (TIGR02246 family)
VTVEELYANLMEAWNKRDAKAFEELFILDGDMVGFDGTQIHGQGQIREHLAGVFQDHPTRPYVYRITGVTQVSTDVAILRAIAGMPDPETSELDPKLHAVHRLTAVFRGGSYRVALFQNTPAQFQGAEQLTADLRAAK